MIQPVLRFAPSPSGELHLGHALSAILNRQMATQLGGRLLLRFDDNDCGRWRAAYEKQILDDMAWLGIAFDGDPIRLSDARLGIDSALKKLNELGLLYSARLSRKEVKEIAATFESGQEKPWPHDPDGSPHYPGLEFEPRRQGNAALRLNMQKALKLLGQEQSAWQEFDIAGNTLMIKRPIREWGDVIVQAKSGDDTYAFATIVHDDLLGISHVVRGTDMQESTTVQRVFQDLLGLNPPLYHHHRLIMGSDERKLSKSENALSLKTLRREGMTRAALYERLGLSCPARQDPS